jgi:hypothetical protein
VLYLRRESVAVARISVEKGGCEAQFRDLVLGLGNVQRPMRATLPRLLLKRSRD